MLTKTFIPRISGSKYYCKSNYILLYYNISFIVCSDRHKRSLLITVSTDQIYYIYMTCIVIYDLPKLDCIIYTRINILCWYCIKSTLDCCTYWYQNQYILYNMHITRMVIFNYICERETTVIISWTLTFAIPTHDLAAQLLG